MRIRIVTDGETYLLQRKVFFWWGRYLPRVRTYIRSRSIAFSPEYRFIGFSHEEAHKEAAEYLLHFGPKRHLYKTEVFI